MPNLFYIYVNGLPNHLIISSKVQLTPSLPSLKYFRYKSETKNNRSEVPFLTVPFDLHRRNDQHICGKYITTG